MNLSITDLVTEEGNWNNDALQTLFTDQAIKHFHSIKYPNPLDEDDRCVWRWTPKQTFDLKSAYANLAGSLWSPKHAIWPVIWHLTVPQRIRLFLWTAQQQKLMTSVERYRRNLSSSPSCLICCNHAEIVLHSLRDCDSPKQIWLQILPKPLVCSFFSMDIHQWLSCNLSSNFLHYSLDISRKLLSASFVWQLWKCRNDYVFNNKGISDATIIHQRLTWAKCFYGNASPSNATPLQSHSTVSKWIAPRPSWFCLNVDGFISASS
ncbi:hypothetical protein V6N12_045266 [Hibiscus sabdariffa]|uniref:Reverse transcriptase zinc-binding domain-containing protein n=1 Tax=Hibiscus sabdariffa TaxID=183260 RepID=A0ABR2G2A6_9ROSI